MEGVNSVLTNDYISDFLNNKLWLHISKKDIELVDDLMQLIPGVRFCSEDELNSKVMNRALESGEAWFRCHRGVSYTNKHPRGNSCRNVSPWIYDQGEIVDIKDFINYKKININENDLIALIS